MNLKIKGFSKNLCAKLGIFLCAVILSVSVTSQSLAQPETPCDPQYMDALEARAWLEAQREITQNQNLIYKPDSVLEYTCFHGFLDEAASNFGEARQFSETDRWDGYPEGFSDETTDDALTAVVLAPVTAYLAGNFNTDGEMGTFLNNRTDFEYLPFPAVDGGRAYGCNQMQAVWAFSRCQQFNELIDFDGFYDFAWYEENDPRQDDNGEWNMICEDPDDRIPQARITAFNEDQVLFNVETEIFEAEGDGEPYLEDDVVTHLDLILPGACEAGIPTGISVQRPDINGGSPYDEVVCPNPGCAATPGGACN